MRVVHGMPGQPNRNLVKYARQSGGLFAITKARSASATAVRLLVSCADYLAVAPAPVLLGDTTGPRLQGRFENVDLLQQIWESC